MLRLILRLVSVIFKMNNWFLDCLDCLTCNVFNVSFKLTTWLKWPLFWPFLPFHHFNIKLGTYLLLFNSIVSFLIYVFPEKLRVRLSFLPGLNWQKSLICHWGMDQSTKPYATEWIWSVSHRCITYRIEESQLLDCGA